jgi:disulfide oxidoreductase YuzD
MHLHDLFNQLTLVSKTLTVDYLIVVAVVQFLLQHSHRFDVALPCDQDMSNSPSRRQLQRFDRREMRRSFGSQMITTASIAAPTQQRSWHWQPSKGELRYVDQPFNLLQVIDTRNQSGKLHCADLVPDGSSQAQTPWIRLKLFDASDRRSFSHNLEYHGLPQHQPWHINHRMLTRLVR